MNLLDLRNKIDIVINSETQVIRNLETKREVYKLQFSDKKEDFKDLKYLFELEKYNFQMLKCDNEIGKNRHYINRIVAYKNYLSSLEFDNPFMQSNAKYGYIKALRDETIFVLDAKIKECSQIEKLNKLSNKESDIIKQKEKYIRQKGKLMNKFLNQDFIFNEEEINTVFYLNYNVSGIIMESYKGKKRKAS